MKKLLFALVLVLLVSVQAEAADPVWTHEVDFTVHPTSLSVDPWVLTHNYNGGVGSIYTDTSQTPSISAFLISTLFEQDSNYVLNHGEQANPWTDTASNATGWTVETRLRVTNGGDYYTNGMGMIDGAYNIDVVFNKSSIILPGLYYVEGDRTYNIPYTNATWDDYHVVRITCVGTAVKLYVDNTLRLTATAVVPQSGSRYLNFGDGSNGPTMSGDVSYDYLKYYTGGAVPPTPPPPPPAWTHEVDFTVHPDSLSIYPWVVTHNYNGGVGSIYTDTSQTPSISAFLISTLFEQDSNYIIAHTEPFATPWTDTVSNATGWTVEARLRITNGGDYYTNSMGVQDGAYTPNVLFNKSSIILPGSQFVEEDQTYNIPHTNATWDDYHVVRMTCVGTSFKLYVDNALRLTATANVPYSGKLLNFGDGSNEPTMSGTASWDYLKYYTGGAVPPTPNDYDNDGDVDADDYDAFEACASGPDVPLTPGCEGKDRDGDNDVDQSDFGKFQRCYSGAGNPGDLDCE